MSSFTINSNIAALSAQRRLNESTHSLTDSFTRLSSGLRINKASDDAAGLAISTSLDVDQAILRQGVRNLNDGISLLSIAESAIESLSSIVIRLEELATQASSGVYSREQRAALDAEAQALSAEFFRITQVTKFNNEELLTGQNQSIALQAGVGANATLLASVSGAIGNGSFEERASYSSESVNDISLGDINNDGILDLVSAGDAGAGTVRVRLGSEGGFEAATTYSAEGLESFAVELKDLNNDGVLDIVSAGLDGSGGVATVRLGDGTGSFGTATSYAMNTNTTEGLAVADLNDDGILDLVSSGDTSSTAGTIAIRLGDGSGAFGSVNEIVLQNSTTYSDVSIGDLNNDGILDFAATGTTGGLQARVQVGLGDGTGDFTALASFQISGENSSAIELADVNRDGVLDVVTAGSNATAKGVTTVQLGLGDGTFGADTSYSSITAGSSRFSDLSLGDANGDGILDLVAAGLSGFSIRLGDNNGGFGEEARTNTGGATNLRSATLGDIDRDGVLDIIFGEGGGATTGEIATYSGESISGVAPLLEFSLATIADARQALPVFQRKRELLALQQANIGAYQARIEVASRTLSVTAENYQAASSQIKDADIALEAALLVKNSILQDASTAVLAQANQQPSIVLTLLTTA